MSERNELKNIVHTSHVAHVTFYIIKHEDREQWKLFSETEKDGIRECRGEAHYDYEEAPTQNEYYNEYDSYEEAIQGLEKEIARLERVLEKKRNRMPTSKQVYFLFCEKIPISIDLTWGQAHDLIEERIAQMEYERLQKQIERFQGFVEGDRVSLTWGKKIIKGYIKKLYQAGRAGKFALIEVEDGTTYRIRNFRAIQKLDESEATEHQPSHQ
jgi:hypothetical protein